MNQDKKILIVEDEASLRQVLADALRGKDYIVLEANDGVEGLKVALREHPDLILLDIIMPRMDGMTMFRKLREDSWGKGASVVMLTNLSDTEKVEEAIDGGVFPYLVKTDWTLAGIMEKVKEQLEK